MKQKNAILLGILTVGFILLGIPSASATAGATLATLSYLGQSGLPRGIRNNNPGNIRITSTPWQGKVPVAENTDGAFEQFTGYVWGVRAMIKTLLSYQANGYGDTLTKIISRWAPPSDGNDTSAYINRVSAATGIAPGAQINLSSPDTMQKVVIAMSEVENGRPAVTPDQIRFVYQNLL